LRRTLSVVCALLLLLAACKRKATVAEDVRLANKVAARNITLFYETDRLLLGPEQRTVQLPENESAAMPAVVRELVKGSANASVAKPFPPDVVVRGVYRLPDGTAIVDLGGNSLATGWSTGSHAELLALYSVVTTLTTNFPTVKQVRFLVNGQVSETFAGHIDLAHALRPSTSYVAQNVQAPQAATR
jgi:spore germination protein GerM